MADAPKRACRFVLDLQADTRQGLADSLYNMASRIERGEMTQGVSGGYSSGYIYELTESDRPTHDEWARDLRVYLAAKTPAGVAASPAAPGALDTEAAMLERIAAAVPAPHDTSLCIVARRLRAYGVMPSEPPAWEFTGPGGLKRFLTQKQYEAQTPATQKWYRPICSKCGPSGVAPTEGAKR